MRKVGMLGAGFILASHARSVRALSDLELSVIGDASQSRADAARIEFGFAETVGSIEEMAASACDTVHVLLPPVFHEQAARALLASGKHVFVEKPFVLSSAVAHSLAASAQSAGLHLGVNHNFLFGRNYQPLRETVRSGGLGRIDHLSVDWHYQLPFIKHGPFDNWIVSAPANPLFEIGPHPIAFVLDLVGDFTLQHVSATDSTTLPTGITVPQRWHILGRSRQGTVAISLAFTRGHEARTVAVRGEGGGARYDFGRDIAVQEQQQSDNPMIDTFRVGRSLQNQLKAQVGPDLRRHVAAALRKRPGATPFEDSVFRSIAGFYGSDEIDVRHDASFAARTIEHVERIAEAAGLEGPGSTPLVVPRPQPERRATVLVVGGTGFIGRALCQRLIRDGFGVRVLSRSGNSAAIALAGLPIEIVTGSHGDPTVLREVLAGIVTVYHLAKCEGRKWSDYVNGDIAPTRRLAEAAAEAGVKRFIYTGTIDSYDSASPKRRIDNTTPVDSRIAGRNLYARSKAACEAVLQQLAAERGLNVVIMRPGIVIGPGSPPAHPGVGNFANATEITFWGDGTNLLPLVHVDDVADALAKAATAPEIDGQTLLVSGPPLLSARDYVRSLEQLGGIRVRSAAGSPLRFWLADLVKETAKHLVRHPNRRKSTWHDWACKTHRAHYDPTQTQQVLDWHPISDPAELARRGIGEALDLPEPGNAGLAG